MKAARRRKQSRQKRRGYGERLRPLKTDQTQKACMRSFYVYLIYWEART